MSISKQVPFMMNKHPPWEVGPPKHLGFIGIFAHGHIWAGMKSCVRARVSAFLSHFKFRKGICKEASWIGLKIGPLQPILAAKRYVSFFLGHPVKGTYCRKFL